ncbi:MAG: DUF4810 domain-containing protein [Opitutaceae bacterium]
MAALVAGCQSPDIYYWGSYEKLIYVSYAKPDKATPEMQAQVMEEDMHEAISANKPLPPGFHAHLGYLYYQMGKSDLAVREFQKEKEQFPESTVFMNRLIANSTRK